MALVEWEKFTVPQLRTELAKRGLSTGGLKKTLIIRLKRNNAIEAAEKAPAQPSKPVTIDYDKLTVPQLRAELAKRGLQTGGLRAALLKRLSLPKASGDETKSKIAGSGYATMKVVNLKKELEKRNLSTLGNKAALIARLETDDANKATKAAPSSRSITLSASGTPEIPGLSEKRISSSKPSKVPFPPEPSRAPSPPKPSKAPSPPKPSKAPSPPKLSRAPSPPKPSKASSPPKPSRAPSPPKPSKAPSPPKPSKAPSSSVVPPQIIDDQKDVFRYSPNYEYSRLLPLRSFSAYGKDIKQLGEGSYGTVHKYSGALGDFAIKISIFYATESDYFPKLDNVIEIAVLKRLRHPSIVSIVDMVTSQDTNEFKMGIVLPLATSDLKRVIEDAQLSLDTKNSLAYQMLVGVAYLHSRHIIHRDIKPPNFLFVAPSTVLLSDLGMAKPFACDPNNLWTNLVYTLWYRPPEVLLSGKAKYTASADIWALACSIWELYTGRPLFPGDSEIDQIFRIFKATGTPNAQLWPEALTMSEFKSSFPKWRPNRAQYIIDPLPNADIARLIDSMLQLDPLERPIAYDILKDSYFDSVRQPPLELALGPEGCFVSHETRDRYAKPYMQNQVDINESMRTILVDWLAAVNTMFKLHMNTFLLTCTYLDQMLALMNVARDKLQLVGVVALSFASQINEMYSPEINDYVYIADHAYTIEQINEMRLRVFKLMNGDFLVTTPYTYHEETHDYQVNTNIWALTKALMVTTTISSLRFKLLPHEIYYFCLGAAYKRSGLPADTDQMTDLAQAHGQALIEEIRKKVKTKRNGIIKMFDKLTGGNPSFDEYFG